MSEIRPFRQEDLPEVADLYELTFRSGAGQAPPGLEPYLARMLGHPWSDPEIPSLVHVGDGGAIDGFQGSHVRRALLDGQAIRIACAGQLIAHPAARTQAVGLRLVRTYLQGPQELTITDGATEPMRQMWVGLGGQMSHLQCLEWVRPLPHGGDTGRPRRSLARAIPAPPRVAAALEVAGTRWRRFAPPPPPPDSVGEALTPASLLEHLPLVTQRMRLYLNYDEPFLQWLFAEAAAVPPRGKLVANLVRDPARGRVLGWYVAYLLRGAASHVLQLVGTERHVGTVLDHLLHAAWSAGAAEVRGRVEPYLLQPASRRGCNFAYSGASLLHSAEDGVLAALGGGTALLTRLDGEWWMGPHILDFGTGAPHPVGAGGR